MTRLIPIGVVCVLLCGCSDPGFTHQTVPPLPVAGPSPTPPNISGPWNGQMALSFLSQKGEIPITVQFTHAGSQITGSWAAHGVNEGLRGAITGSVSQWTLQFEATWDSAAASGSQRCTGRALFSGSIEDDAFIGLHSNGFSLDQCSNPPTSVRWILTR